MKKIILLIIGLLIVGVASMPLIVKKKVTAMIDIEKKSLIKSGVELTITKEEGYISSKREFDLTIVDGKKFRDFIFNSFSEKNPNYKGLTELLKKQSDKDIRPALDGTLFKGNIKNSNLLLNAPLIELSLSKFSDEIMSSFNGHRDAEQLVNSILDEKLFTFFITLDSKQKISQIIMKDIDKDINENGKTTNVKLKNHKLDINIQESLKGVYTLGEQSISTDNFNFEIRGIKYTFDYLTQFDNSGNISIDNFTFKEGIDFVKIGNIDISSSVKTTENETLRGDINYVVNDFHVNKIETVKLDSINLKFNIYGLNKNEILDVNNYYSKLAFHQSTISKSNIESLTKSIEKILRRGFKFDTTFSINGLNIKDDIALKNLDFTINAELKKNSYSLSDMKLINSFIATGKIIVDKVGANKLLKLNNKLEQFVSLGKEDGNNLLYDYEFKNGALYLNGTKIK